MHNYLADFRHSTNREFFRFGDVHLPWLYGIFKHHPRGKFVEGKRLYMFPGMLHQDIDPWVDIDSGEPEMTEYAPEYAYLAA